MATTVSGMPLLSGPPPGPDANESACRKCNKEFNVIFARSRKCNHCGHLYCQSCTDYQALMPRQGGGNAGYDPVPVCAYCIENLTITAAGKGQLRKYSLAKLRKYAKDYNINVNGVIEKDDLIDKIIAARAPNGCMPPANEKYYRLYSVPQPPSDRPRGIFTRAMEAMGGAPSGSTPQHQHQPAHQQQVPPYAPRQRTTSHPAFPRPDLDDRPPQDNAPPRWAQYTPPPPQQQQPPPQPPRQPPPPQQQQQRPSPAPGSGGYTHNYQTYNSQSRRQYQPPPGPPPGGPIPPNAQYNPPPRSFPGHNFSQQGNPRRPNHNTPPGGQRPRSASASAPGGSAPRSPPQTSGASTRGASPAATPAGASTPVPTLDELLALAPEALGALSVSALKAVLFRNHVHTGVVVEKAELVAKVRALVDAERREREDARRRAEAEERERRQAEQREDEEDEEMREVLERSRREHEEFERRREEVRREQEQAEQEQAADAPAPPTEPHDDTNTDGAAEGDKGKAAAPKLSAKAQAMASHLERTGLCVVCQDEEANIAIVDCGHLAMCRACADLVMASTRECPLCRTRIVTEARLLRIFKP